MGLIGAIMEADLGIWIVVAMLGAAWLIFSA